MKKSILALVIVALMYERVPAADFYWDSDLSATVPGNNDVGNGDNLGGPGTWDTASTAWWDGTSTLGVPNPNTTWSDANTAIFWGPSAGAVTLLGTTRSPIGLTFKTDGYDITATGTTSATRGTLAFGTTTPSIVVDPNIKATITARLTGTAGYNVSGGGTLRLAEPNSTAPSYGGLNTTTGPVSVSSSSIVNATTPGTVLEVIGGGQIGNSSATSPITLNGGTYRNVDPTVTVGGVGPTFQFTTATSRPWVIGANGGVFDTPIATSIFLNTGTITGTAGSVLTKIGPGEVRMSAAAQVNTFEKLVINEGRFTVGQATTLGQDTQLGAVPGAYLADALTLDGMNGGAILRFAGGSATTTTTLSSNRGITLGTTYGSTNTFQVDNSNAAIPSIITGPGGFIKTGGLALTLSGASTYMGTTTVNAGILRLSNTTGSGVGSGPVSVGSSAGGNLQITTDTGSQASGGVTINANGILSGNGALSGTLAIASGGKVTPGIGGGNAVLTVPNADFSTGAILESTLGSASSSDVLKVTTASTGLNLNGGTVSLVPLGAANVSGQTFTLIDYTTGYTGTVGSMLLNDLTGFDGTALFDDVANHAIKVTVGSAAIDRTWIREFDFGQWNNDAPPGPNESANWAKFDGSNWSTPATAANGIGSIARFPAQVPIGLPNAGNPIPTQSITISDFNKIVGTLELDNPNSLTFGTANSSRLIMQTYSGNALIDVKQGTHTIATGAAGAGGAITFTSQTDVNVASGATLTLAPVANTGGMNKNGPGSLFIINNDWTGTGATNINDGVLQYASNNAAGLGNASTVTIGSMGTLDMNSASGHKVNDTIGALAGSGKFVNHGNLTIAGSNTSPVTFSGEMRLTGGNGANDDPFIGNGTTTGRVFTKNGAGTQIISATLESTSSVAGGNFNLPSTVAAGTLILNNPAGTSLTTSTTLLTVASGATLGGNGHIAGPVTIAVGGNLSPGASIGTFHLGAGTLTFNSATTGTLKSNLNIELNTTLADGDISDLVDASGANVVFGVNLPNRPTLNITNAGTMTGGTYTILKYGTLANGFANLPVFGTTPAGFLFKYDTSTANQVKLDVHFLGDFNNDNVVDAADYVVWRNNEGLGSGALFTQGDGNGDGAVNSLDYAVWRANFGNSITVGAGSGLEGGAVPEPATSLLLIVGLAAIWTRRCR